MHRIGLILVVAMCALPVHAFVLLSGPTEARLPVSPETPTITFYWDGSVPTLQNQGDVLDGRLLQLSDHDAMKQGLLYALNAWSEIPGSYLRFALVEQAGVLADAGDGKNVIVVKHDKNVTSSAYASPKVEGKTIVDCDIHIADSSVPLKTLIYIITHELGHCIGLGHAHTNYGAIMGYSRSQHALSLGADDMAGLIYLYPDPNYSDGKVNDFGACGKVDSPRPSGHNRTAVNLSFLLPLLFAGLFLRRKP